MEPGVDLRVHFDVDDAELSALHGEAFGDAAARVQPWAARLQRHGLTWVGAFDANALVGFVHVCWDGGAHAFLLDTVVRPSHQRRGVGRALVWSARDEAGRAGCQWLHVDYEPDLQGFYRDSCGFAPTAAGLVRLADSGTPSLTGRPGLDDTLRLRAMTEAEFEDYRDRLVAAYAEEHVRAGNWRADEAPSRSTRALAELLPHGRGTAGMLFLVAETASGESVGTVWISLAHAGEVVGTGWLYDIELAPEHRGRGLGRSLLRAAEEETRRHGLAALGLNVFGSNVVARRLYTAAGYDVVSQQMRKWL